ncbi:MAG TPA: 50S ribosomal protein L18Ae, partial [Methanospirillum sp.]|uniref:50S ribosomal protein L18Ae n=1 Tax=Methanospirillum sp. TaxID=45200 RepID=UPI002CAAE490
GTYQERRDFWKPYTKVLSAPNAVQAKERIYTIIGSKHRLARPYIKVESVSEMSGE